MAMPLTHPSPAMDPRLEFFMANAMASLLHPSLSFIQNYPRLHSTLIISALSPSSPWHHNLISSQLNLFIHTIVGSSTFGTMPKITTNTSHSSTVKPIPPTTLSLPTWTSLLITSPPIPTMTPLPPSPLPPPTFAIDNYALYSPSHGFVASNPFHFIDSLLSQHIFFALDIYHAPMIPSLLFDSTPPPTYSYLQALSSFSAVVQPCLHSGQLNTSLSLSRCLSDGSQPWCHFSCHAIEDSHHIFIQCHCFDAFHDNTITSILSSSTMLLDASTLDPTHHQMILEQARGLFYDSDMSGG